MSASCVACRSRGPGMVAIYKHPNGLDQMFTSVTGIEVESEDNLCIPCYDDLRAAHIFKQKCIQNNILRISRPQSTKAENSARMSSDDSIHSEETITKPAIAAEQASVVEISTTSLADVDIRERVEVLSDVSDGETEVPEDIEEIKINAEELESVKQDTSYETLHDKSGNDSKLLNSIHYNAVEVVEEVRLEPVRCEECGKAFSKTSTLQKHIRTCHQAESTDSEQITVGALATLPVVHNLMCEYCFQEFTSMTEKFEHESSHTTESKPYKCPQCQGSFKDKVGLRSHIRIHSSVKRYKCQYCEMRFHQRGNLTAHERTHVGAKPFLCPHCGKGFAESGNLKNHIRFHTGERPYACSECPKRFRTHYSRTVHFRSHSNDRPFSCSECDKAFYSSGKLIIHRRVHSGEKPYKCETCPAKFADSSGLKRHIKTH